MDKSDFDREIQYQLTMLYVKQLKRNGTITEAEYRKADTIMLKKYRPVIGTLLSGNIMA